MYQQPLSKTVDSQATIPEKIDGDLSTPPPPRKQNSTDQRKHAIHVNNFGKFCQIRSRAAYSVAAKLITKIIV